MGIFSCRLHSPRHFSSAAIATPFSSPQSFELASLMALLSPVSADISHFCFIAAAMFHAAFQRHFRDYCRLKPVDTPLLQNSHTHYSLHAADAPLPPRWPPERIIAAPAASRFRRHFRLLRRTGCHAACFNSRRRFRASYFTPYFLFSYSLLPSFFILQSRRFAGYHYRRSSASDASFASLPIA